MAIPFVKMHGLGNDYVYVDVFERDVSDPALLAQRVSDRHRGIGSDGLILIGPAAPGVDAHARMIMFNADGSRAQMCGNGVRCVAKYVHDSGRSTANPLRIETDRGVLTLDLSVNAARQVNMVRADMGAPILEPARIPVKVAGPRAIRSPIVVDGIEMRMTCVSMGNPHAVFYVPSLEAVALAKWGPLIERHELFPERVNAHFVEILGPDRVRMATWERGAGATRACGTGACAVCVAGVLEQRTERKLTATLPGGDLRLEWPGEHDSVFMTGPAVEVFRGEWPDERFV